MIVCVYECVVITQMPRNELDLFKDKKKIIVFWVLMRETLLMTIKHIQSLFLSNYTWT